MKHLLRRLKRSPMFTAMTLVTLAVGIGANTAVFSVVNGVLLKPLAYPHAERLVAVWQTAPGANIPQLPASPATYFTYREDGRAFEDIGLWTRGTVSITGIAEPEEVPALFVTDGALPVLGVQPALGRWFSRQDDTPGTPDTVMLSHGYWQQRFGGAAGMIGRRIIVDSVAREIIGVMPARFQFLNQRASLFVPLRFDRGKTFIGNFSYQAVARLKPGVTTAMANADVARMIPTLPDKFNTTSGMGRKMFEETRMAPDVRPLKDDVVGDSGKLLWVLMGTVGIVLFIACANVANLLLVRAEGRQRELAIRAALGAGRAHIARELLFESTSLGLTGGVLGLGLAYGGLRALVALAPAGLPRLTEIGIDSIGLAFTLLISLAAGFLFGLIPVFKYAGPRLIASMREGGRGSSAGRERHRARSVLVVVQVALALVLLVSSGLMIRSFAALKQVQPGFTRPEEILTLKISIPRAQVADADAVVRMQDQIRQRIAQVAGVSSVGIGTSITMDGGGGWDPIWVEGRTYIEGKMPPVRRYKYVAPGFFQAMGNPVVAGRDLTWSEVYDHRLVVMVSENLAREYWGAAASAIGKRVRESDKGPWREIVGVAGDERDAGLDHPAGSVVYWPLVVDKQWGSALQARRSVAYAVRSPRTGSAGFLKEVQQAIWSVNSTLPVADVKTVQQIYEKSMARTSFALTTLVVAAAMALLLGIVGIYGVISYSVSQRTREIGIRMALGARQQEVRRLFVRHGLVLACVGLLCGLGVAAVSMRWLSSLLFEVRPVDPLTYGAVCLVLLAAAMLASYLPARRATIVEPVEALRAE